MSEADNVQLRAALESTLRALQKAINGNQMDSSWIMAELEARDALCDGRFLTWRERECRFLNA